MAHLELTLDEVADLVGGGRIIGDGAFHCRRVAPLETATEEDLSFVRDRKAEAAAADSRAGALVVARPVENGGVRQLVVADVMDAMIRLLSHLAVEKRRQAPGVHPRAFVDETAELGAEVVIGPGAVVSRGVRLGDRTVVYANAFIGARCEIGADCMLHPNVTIMEDVRLGERVIVHPGAVVGSDGYGFVARNGRQVRVPQVGEVVIGDDVEVGACATIDRATLAATRIGSGTKIGDLVHVAHNVEIGEDCLVLPTAAISGSARIGKRVVFAGRAGCSDGVRIGDGAILAAAAVAYQDVEPGAVVWGNPARPKSTEMRIQSLLPRLPEIVRQVRQLRRELEGSTRDQE